MRQNISRHPTPQNQFLTTKHLPYHQLVLPEHKKIVGCILFYSRAIYGTILPSLSDIISEQSKSTEATAEGVVKLLNYCATFPGAVVKYIASNMCLWIESDSPYLSVQKSRIRAGGFFYLSDHPSKVPQNQDP